MMARPPLSGPLGTKVPLRGNCIRGRIIGKEQKKSSEVTDRGDDADTKILIGKKNDRCSQISVDWDGTCRCCCVPSRLMTYVTRQGRVRYLFCPKPSNDQLFKETK